MAYPLRHQPIRGIYLTYELFCTAFLRLPIWIILSIPKSWRPRPSWTITRSVWIRVCRHIGTITSRTGNLRTLPTHHAIIPGPGVKGVWVEPVPQLITGELQIWAFAASVTAIRIPGYWYHKEGSTISVAAPPMPGEKVVLSLHGGGYRRLSAHPSDVVAAIPRGLLKNCDTVHRVLSLEYRLSSTVPYDSANPFPAALLDAVAGYAYLVNTVGFSPSDIIIEGDSAGGNLAHALTRYLVEYHNTPDLCLPGPPSALILLSPWSDVGTSHDTPGSSVFTLRHTDYIGQEEGGFDYSHKAFLGPHGMGAAALNRYISPASLHPSMEINFRGFPRTFIVAGGAETMVDPIRTLKDRMMRDLGEGDGIGEGEGRVRYYESADGVHDYLIFPWHEPENRDTLREIGKWVDAA